MMLILHYLLAITRCLFFYILFHLLISCQPSTRNDTNDQLRSHDNQLSGNVGLSLSEGLSAIVVAENIGSARHMTVRDNGDIYVALKEKKQGGGIAALRDVNGDGVADIIEYFGHEPGTGIDVYDGYLYFASNTSIYRYTFLNDNLIPSSDVETVISGFPDQESHNPLTFAINKEEGYIYVNIGAPSNNCMEEKRTQGSPGKLPCDEREIQAAIWRFDARRIGQSLQKDGNKFAKGIRNSVAIDYSTEAKNLYVVQHGRDQLNEFFPELYDERSNAELPPEEFLMVKEGMDNGWPYCYYDHFQEKRVLAPEYGGDGKKVEDCEKYPPPMMSFPAHWAPNDLLFYNGNQLGEKYNNGAFIAFHGSWDRSPLEQQGYFVAFVPFEGETPTGSWERFADGFAGSTEVHNPGDAEYRPIGLAQGGGALFIVDSQKGKLWRIFSGETQPL